MRASLRRLLPHLILVCAFVATIGVYGSGLSGGFLFDDYPNIVENHGVQPKELNVASLVRAALSSPSSEFKRPLASLSFAANYLATGLDPYWMKLTNLVIHLLNGWLIFLLSRMLLGISSACAWNEANPTKVDSQTRLTAALIAGGWMLLPINLTAVVYVVQRMESMANFFVLLGLVGYVTGRKRMLADHVGNGGRGWLLCLISLTAATILGLLAKETAVMLPLYAFFVEWLVFRFRAPSPCAAGFAGDTVASCDSGRPDRRIVATFVAVLLLPMVAGLAWLLPGLFHASRWATRDFTMATRLLSEARIVADYVAWTLFPTPGALSFYHDDFPISTGLLTPWTTLASMMFLAGLAGLMFWMRKRRPLAALGIAFFLGCHLLTGTVLPLELIYEHRNYFASFGLLLAIVPYLAAPSHPPVGAHPMRDALAGHDEEQIHTPEENPSRTGCAPTESASASQPFALPRYTLLAGLLLSWASLTAFTAYAWGNPLRLAEDLASRAPLSPRAQYELGRTYIIYSHYKPNSPFTQLAYAPLEKSAALPNSSILPEQALIFMNARMHLPLKDTWWDSMIAKLKTATPGVQDESSLGALTQCAREGSCDLPTDRMMEAFMAALSHPNPRPRLLATYGDYAWNVLKDHDLGERMTEEAVQAKPDEPAYRITLVRMLAARGRNADAEAALKQLEKLNIGGRLDGSLSELRGLLDLQ